MRIPTTPAEAQELEQKMAANQEAGDWVEPVFPTAGLSVPVEKPIDTLLKTLGDVRLPPKK